MSVVSFFLFLLASDSTFQVTLLLGTAFIGWHVSIMVLLIIGITLYMYGYLRREAQPSKAGVIFLSLFVILWGVFTYFVAAGALAAWDYVGFWIWEIKGIFGIGTGLMLIITSLLKGHMQRTAKLDARVLRCFE